MQDEEKFHPAFFTSLGNFIACLNIFSCFLDLENID